MTNFQIAIQFFLQLSLILCAIKIVGYIGKRFFGQPQVVSEMLTGILLGPSLFGAYFPDLFRATFPKESLPVLYCAAQVGLVLYMFVIGCEFRIDLFMKRAKTAAAVSISGIAVPFAIAWPLAALVLTGAPFFEEGLTIFHRWLFLSAAISITAFPMLARIIHEAKIGSTSMGTIALAAAAIDDATAWCLLALVIAAFASSPWIAVMAIGGGVAYAIFTLGALRPLLAWYIDRQKVPGKTFELSDNLFGLTLILLMLSAYFTDRVGIYAVFGAFLLGVAMPKGAFNDAIRGRLEPLTVKLFLPLFFINSGLNTKLSLLLAPSAFGVALLILVASIFGKFVACSLSAYLGGEDTRSALCIGTLMNARGLMELILLNIGLERGIITETLFTALVVMAVVTTLMATPVFNWIVSFRNSSGGLPKVDCVARPG